LIKGNHDILSSNWYQEASIEVKNEYKIHQFIFIHDPNESVTTTEDGSFIFSGHLHPGIIVRGLGKQSLRFPCFYFTEKQAILPAFSQFSGLALIEPKKKDQVYAIVNQSILQIQ